MMDKDPGFGVSQFMENARYQHALGDRARPHHRQPAAGRGRARASRRAAPVRVRPRSPRRERFGVRAAEGRASASSRSRSRPSSTSWPPASRTWKPTRSPWSTSRAGCCPRRTDTTSSPCAKQQFDMVHRLEDDYAQRIEALLTPLVGTGRVRAQVVAQMDMAVTEEAREQYKPDSQIVRSEQTSEQTSRDGCHRAPRASRCADQPAARRRRRCPAAPELPHRQSPPALAGAAGQAAGAATEPRSPARAAHRSTGQRHSTQSTTQLRNRSHRRLHAAAGRPAASALTVAVLDRQPALPPARTARSKAPPLSASSSSTTSPSWSRTPSALTRRAATA